MPKKIDTREIWKQAQAAAQQIAAQASGRESWFRRWRRWLACKIAPKPLGLPADGCFPGLDIPTGPGPVYQLGRPTPMRLTHHGFSGMDCQVALVPTNCDLALDVRREEHVPLMALQQITIDSDRVAVQSEAEHSALRRIAGTLEFVFFGDEPLPARFHSGWDLVVTFNNEYGNGTRLRLRQMVIETFHTSVEVDALLIPMRYRFRADTVEFGWTGDDRELRKEFPDAFQDQAA